MKFVHTSDWHLGRIFHEVHLTEDQAYVLDQLERLIKDERPDALLISGDVYDRAVPPVDAVRLLDDFLQRVVLGLKVPVAMIAGNHDSPDRLSFGSSLFGAQGLHVAGSLATLRKVVFMDEYGPVDVLLAPYARPEEVRAAGLDGEAKTHEDALTAQLARGRSEGLGPRSIVLAHAFVSGMAESESERLLSVGGTGTVSIDRFQGFGYAALGHLHRPQEVGTTARYSGSILKYSFSESEHRKSAVLGEMDREGKVKTRLIDLSPRHEVRRIEGYFRDLVKPTGSKKSREDYIEFSLLDRGPVLDAMGRLREVYPNALRVRRPEIELGGRPGFSAKEHRKISHDALFERFYEDTTGEKLSAEQRNAFLEILEEVESCRETAS